MAASKLELPQRSALIHVVSREYAGNVIQGRYTVTRYHAFSIRVRRPARGSTLGEQACGACGQPQVLKVSSRGRQKAVQAILAAISLAGLAGFLATVIYFINAPVRDESIPSSLEGPPGWLLFLGTIGAPLVAIFAASFVLTYDGVRIKGLPRRTHYIS